MTFSERIRAWLDAIEGDIVVPVEAAKLVAAAREQFPNELAEWLDEHAETFVADRMARLSVSERATAQRRQASRAFGDAAASEDEAVTAFLDVRYVVDDENTRRRLREMTRDDLEFAAADYDERAKANAFESAFLRAVAKRVTRGRVVGDVFTDDQLRALRKAGA